MNRIFSHFLIVLLILTLPLYKISQGQSLAAQNLGVDPFFDSIYQVAHVGVDTERIRSYCNIATMIQDVALTKRYIDTAKTLFARRPTRANELKIAVTEASYYATIANFEQAYQLYKKAFPLADELEQHERAADLRFQVGDMLVEMYRFDEAERYYWESIEKTKWIETNFDKLANSDRSFTDVYALYAFAYLRLGKLYSQIPQKYNQVESTLNLALSYAEKVHPILTGEVHIVFAQYYLRQKVAEKAAKSIYQLDKIDKEFGIVAGNQISWLNELIFLRGSLATLKGDTEGGVFYLTQAKTSFEKSGDVKSLAKTYQLLTDLYQSQGNYQKAFESQSQFLFYNDSLTRKSQFITINTLETQFQTQKKEAQIEQQNTEITQKRRVQWGLLVGLIILAASAFLLLRQNRKIKMAHEKIKKQTSQLELMMKELHHRVKNNLQIVSSLLSLQSFQTSDKNAATAIQQGQTRVEAMSLIHQRLYQTRDVTELNFNAYAQDLIEKLIFAYGFDYQNLGVTLNISEQNIDVDQAMPLGLILNELLTNSFKYAFSTVEKPKLSIDLQRMNDKWQFHYADNGAGLPPQYSIENSTGFGSQLIISLSQQLEGKYTFWNNNGLNFELIF